MQAPPPILVAHDGHSTGPLRTTETLSGLFGLPFEIATVHADIPTALTAPAVPEDPASRAHAITDRALAVLGAEAVTTHVVAGSRPAQALLELAASRQAACIVCGPDVRGHVSRDLLRHATCPVVVAPEVAPATVPEVVTVAYDGSTQSRYALTAAMNVADAAEALLRIVTVTDQMPAPRADALAAHAAAHVPHGMRVESRVVVGAASIQIRAAAGEADLLACGTHGRGALGRATLGSVASVVVADPACPVLVVPPGVRRRSSTPLQLSLAGA